MVVQRTSSWPQTKAALTKSLMVVKAYDVSNKIGLDGGAHLAQLLISLVGEGDLRRNRARLE